MTCDEYEVPSVNHSKGVPLPYTVEQLSAACDNWEAANCTDKFSHGYFPTYQRIAAEIGPAACVAEIGVENGGSLALWQQLFPDGKIVGVDHNPEARWPLGTIKIVDSQSSHMLPYRLKVLSPTGYDLIVDDASHYGVLSAETFRILWPLVKPGRYYVLEDWFVALEEPFKKEYGDSMLLLAESFLSLLSSDSDVESVDYRRGLAVLKKKS